MSIANTTTSAELNGGALKYDDFGSGQFYFSQDKKIIVIGRRGFLWKASTDGTEIAVKLLKIQDREDQENAQSEAHMLETLSLSGFTPLFFGSTRFSDCMALEIELLGPSLWDLRYMDGSSEFSATEMFTLAKELLSALAYLHERSLVHCDVKTANICVKNPNTKSIVAVSVDRPRRSKKLSLSVYPTGDRLATLYYESPEVLFGLPLSDKLDVWAAGMTLAEVLTGNLVFHPSDERELCRFLEAANLLPEAALKSPFFNELRSSNSPIEHFEEPAPFTDLKKHLIENAPCNGWDKESTDRFVVIICSMLTPDASTRPSARSILEFYFSA